MARPVFGRARPPEEGGARVSHLDRDRALVDAARRDPAEFDALYRRYLAQVYSYAFYELGDHHEAEDVTERTFLAALANLDRFEERARPADGEGASTFRVWLFRIARNVVANHRRTRRRRPTAPHRGCRARRRPGRRRGWCRDPRRGRRGVARRRPPARRSAPRDRPSLRRGDVDRRDRRRPRQVRGRGSRPHPSRASDRRPRARPGRPSLTIGR